MRPSTSVTMAACPISSSSRARRLSGGEDGDAGSGCWGPPDMCGVLRPCVAVESINACASRRGAERVWVCSTLRGGHLLAGRGEEDVVVCVRFARLLPVVEQGVRPVLGRAALLVAVPAVHGGG